MLRGQLEDLPSRGKDADDGGVFEECNDVRVPNGGDAGRVIDHATNVGITVDPGILMAGDRKNAEHQQGGQSGSDAYANNHEASGCNEAYRVLAA